MCAHACLSNVSTIQQGTVCGTGPTAPTTHRSMAAWAIFNRSAPHTMQSATPTTSRPPTRCESSPPPSLPVVRTHRRTMRTRMPHLATNVTLDPSVFLSLSRMHQRLKHTDTHRIDAGSLEIVTCANMGPRMGRLVAVWPPSYTDEYFFSEKGPPPPAPVASAVTTDRPLTLATAHGGRVVFTGNQPD